MPKEQPPPPPPWSIVILIAESGRSDKEKKEAIDYLLKNVK